MDWSVDGRPTCGDLILVLLKVIFLFWPYLYRPFRGYFDQVFDHLVEFFKQMQSVFGIV